MSKTVKLFLTRVNQAHTAASQSPPSIFEHQCSSPSSISSVSSISSASSDVPGLMMMRWQARDQRQMKDNTLPFSFWHLKSLSEGASKKIKSNKSTAEAEQISEHTHTAKHGRPDRHLIICLLWKKKMRKELNWGRVHLPRHHFACCSAVQCSDWPIAIADDSDERERSVKVWKSNEQLNCGVYMILQGGKHIFISFFSLQKGKEKVCVVWRLKTFTSGVMTNVTIERITTAERKGKKRRKKKNSSTQIYNNDKCNDTAHKWRHINTSIQRNKHKKARGDQEEEEEEEEKKGHEHQRKGHARKKRGWSG